MAYAYAWVHVTYTIPPAIILGLLYFPLCTKLDLYKIAALVTIAVVSTIPWDSYLIRNNVWSYPPDAIIGPTLLGIPLEEVFFFVIQTVNTSLLYLILNKPLLHPIYLVKERAAGRWVFIKGAGQLAIGFIIKRAIDDIQRGGHRTYLGLILVWAAPFFFIIWTFAYQFLCRLPWTSTLLPIALPTLYLWIVDTMALGRGTWVIESATKTGFTLWPGLEIEEALFFAVTNALIVSGLVAFDNAVAILDVFEAHYPAPSMLSPRLLEGLPSPVLLLKALCLPAAAYDDDRILALQQAVDRLKRKSRSFYLASSTFEGRLRVDMILLYSFCRIADDLVDNAKDPDEAKSWISKMKTYLNLAYGSVARGGDGSAVAPRDANRGAATQYVVQNFPKDMHLALIMLPTNRISKQPLYDLIRGLEMDLAFSPKFPSGEIFSEADLERYSGHVAGTVAYMCIELALYHHPGRSRASVQKLVNAGREMGIALQYTNIARDVIIDAEQNRCYMPPKWLEEETLTSELFVLGIHLSQKNPLSFEFKVKLARLRKRLLDRAFANYTRSRPALALLPRAVQAPFRVAIESYMQLAREMRRDEFNNSIEATRGRVKVPLFRRLRVAWAALWDQRLA